MTKGQVEGIAPIAAMVEAGVFSEIHGVNRRISPFAVTPIKT